jgi:hypothetical protein
LIHRVIDNYHQKEEKYWMMTSNLVKKWVTRPFLPITLSLLVFFSIEESRGEDSSSINDQSVAGFISESMSIRDGELSSIKALSYLKKPVAKMEVSAKKWIANTWRTINNSLYPWKTDITTTTFWIGERPTRFNPVPNDKSSWDGKWLARYGGFDPPDPAQRIGFRPAGFVPKQNPFYVALPYNDIDGHSTKREAPYVIPWFHRDFEQPGKSVVKGRWVAIHHNGKVCFAQWEDCGPYRTDHWQYVFGNERPSPNRNGSAGLDVSPAVRDYLGLGGKDKTDWRFVELNEIPTGPWTKYGENNPFSPYYTNNGRKVDNTTLLKGAENNEIVGAEAGTTNDLNPKKDTAEEIEQIMVGTAN